MKTWITVCDTCKKEGWDQGPMEHTDGEALASLIEAAAKTSDTIAVRRTSCLMGCKHACNVAIQGPGKLNYTLGRFDPTDDAAAGIVEYAEKHAQSDSGQVPFRDWPTAIKGHFVTRHPPLPETE